MDKKEFLFVQLALNLERETGLGEQNLGTRRQKNTLEGEEFSFGTRQTWVQVLIALPCSCESWEVTQLL